MDGRHRRVTLKPENDLEKDFLVRFLEDVGVSFDDGDVVEVRLDPDSAEKILETMPPKFALAWPTGRKLKEEAEKVVGLRPHPRLHPTKNL